jgi:hypothetical protein
VTGRPSGESAPCEAGLRALAAKRGPSLGKLKYAASRSPDVDPELRKLMARTDSMSSSSPHARAEALWDIIQEEINTVNGDGQHPKCVAALRAAFRIPMEDYRGSEYDTISTRLERAREAGAFMPNVGKDAPNNSWRQGVRQLGNLVEERLLQLAQAPEGWLAYQTAALPKPDAPLPPPPDAQPVFLDRLIATYVMSGRAVRHATTERRVTAREDGVDHYIVRAYSPLPGEHKVQVEAILNCRAGPPEVFVHRGRETLEIPMYAPEPLRNGQQWVFVSRVDHPEGGDEEPIVEIQVTSHGIAANGLSMRVQFEEGSYPTSAWWFANALEHRQLVKPPDGHRRRINCTRFGFLEHTFTEVCRPLCKYGLGWQW